MMAQSTRILVTLIAVALIAASAHAQGNDSVATPRIFDALALREGATVCELGAVDGALSIAAAGSMWSRSSCP